MNTRSLDYHGDRFPPEIVFNAVWRSHPFSLSFHDVKERLSDHGVTIGYEAVRPGACSCVYLPFEQKLCQTAMTSRPAVTTDFTNHAKY
jgi:transposase-like protein